MGANYVINSEHSKKAFFATVEKLFDEHKFLTFKHPRIGAQRSLDQNALFHVWIGELAAYYANFAAGKVPKPIIEGMKRTVKRDCYLANGWEFMICSIKCPKTGAEKKDYSSSRDWKRGEMFQVLTWLQATAAGDGVVLEAKGEFQHLQSKQTEV